MTWRTPAARLDARDLQALRREFSPHVGGVLQSRLRRTLADVDELTRAAELPVCKGIYLEPRPMRSRRELIRRTSR